MTKSQNACKTGLISGNVLLHSLLPAEVLHVHLSSQHLVTGGSKTVMTKRLHDVLHMGPMHRAIDQQK